MGTRAVQRSVASAACAGAAILLSAHAGGCGDALPPGLGSTLYDASSNGGEGGIPDLGSHDGPQKRDCNLGPQYGVCACLDQPLLTDPPNIYFVVDKSGSMAVDAKWTNVTVSIANTVLKLGPRIAVGVAAFPDPQAGDCTPGREVMPMRQGDGPAGTRGATYNVLAATLSGMGPSGGTPTAATLRVLLPGLKSLKGKTFVVLATDGGPNCNAAATCTVDKCIVNIEQAAEGCVPGQAPNCCDPAYYGPLNCIDADASLSAVAAIRAADIPVYVMGVPGSGPYAGLLDALAQAGGTARATSPYYYRVDSADQASLQDALAQIAAKITATCTFVLKDTPADPKLVNVFLDDTVVPQDPVDGWSLEGNTVTLLGATCDKVLSGKVLEVHISAGCPTVIR